VSRYNLVAFFHGKVDDFCPGNDSILRAAVQIARFTPPVIEPVSGLSIMTERRYLHCRDSCGALMASDIEKEK
jgi:hypothetical protein